MRPFAGSKGGPCPLPAPAGGAGPELEGCSCWPLPELPGGAGPLPGWLWPLPGAPWPLPGPGVPSRLLVFGAALSSVGAATGTAAACSRSFSFALAAASSAWEDRQHILISWIEPHSAILARFRQTLSPWGNELLQARGGGTNLLLCQLLLKFSKPGRCVHWLCITKRVRLRRTNACVSPSSDDLSLTACQTWCTSSMT